MPHSVVEAAAALRPVIQSYQEEIERERCIPGPLVAGAKVPRARTALLGEQTFVQEAVGRTEAALGAAQAYRAAVTRDIWDTVEAGEQPTLEQQARCRLAATYAVDSAMQAVDLMYRAGGTTSLERPHPLARCWRDVHAVGQSASLHPEWYALTGRVFLGLDPGPRLTNDWPTP
jgi:indole-3-acetate monooxygenase